MTRLIALIDRALAFKYGVHRDTVDGMWGYLLVRRCVDCGRTDTLGWYSFGASNRVPKPWEETA